MSTVIHATSEPEPWPRASWARTALEADQCPCIEPFQELAGRTTSTAFAGHPAAPMQVAVDGSGDCVAPGRFQSGFPHTDDRCFQVCVGRRLRCEPFETALVPFNRLRTHVHYVGSFLYELLETG